MFVRVPEALGGFTHSRIASPDFTNQVPVLGGIIGHEAQSLEEGDCLLGGGREGGVCARGRLQGRSCSWWVKGHQHRAGLCA
jgi:hypothetical protein